MQVAFPFQPPSSKSWFVSISLVSGPATRPLGSTLLGRLSHLLWREVAMQPLCLVASLAFPTGTVLPSATSPSKTRRRTTRLLYPHSTHMPRPFRYLRDRLVLSPG
jgi:hypothetical protein